MENFEQYLVKNFKWFHRHPEMPYEEVQTTAKIRELLTAAGIEILSYPLETGLVAVVRGEKPSMGSDKNAAAGKITDAKSYAKAGGKQSTVEKATNIRAALRCDKDALPLTKQTN